MIKNKGYSPPMARSAAAGSAASPPTVASGKETIYRHRLVTRVTHWINALCITFLLMSGMQIFNAHPRLYWGQYGADSDRAFIEMTAVDDGRGGEAGRTQVGALGIPTTGVLGLSKENGRWTERGFPSWLTLPSYQDLATGRRWHFFLAWFFVINGLVYLLYGIISGHFRRDLATRRGLLPVSWTPSLGVS